VAAPVVEEVVESPAVVETPVEVVAEAPAVEAEATDAPAAE
jgi:hypothetical protein